MVQVLRRAAVVVVCVVAIFGTSVPARAQVKPRPRPRPGASALVRRVAIGVCFVDIVIDPHSDRLADTKFVPTFQDVNTCKKYRLVSVEYSLSNSPMPCRIVGTFRKSGLYADSISTDLDENTARTTLAAYTEHCKAQEQK